jgi:cell division protein FtsB
VEEQLDAPAAPPETPVAAAALGSLADLPVAGLTRRRIGLLVGAVVAAWVIVLFARQVSEAAEATQFADAMRASNAALQQHVDALAREKYLIQREAYIDQQAREYRLGTTREIPFILADDAPALGPDAPGSAGVKLGARPDVATPLESWLRVLFGPDGSGAGS